MSLFSDRTFHPLLEASCVLFDPQFNEHDLEQGLAVRSTRSAKLRHILFPQAPRLKFLRGLQRVQLGAFERYGKVLSGAFIALIVGAFWIWAMM